MSVSHPSSASYGKHFSPEDVIDIFAPSDVSVAHVTDWLVDAGIARERLHLSASRGWIELNATVAEAETLLDTEYHVYTHPSGAEQLSKWIMRG